METPDTQQMEMRERPSIQNDLDMFCPEPLSKKWIVIDEKWHWRAVNTRILSPLIVLPNIINADVRLENEGRL